MGSFKLVRFIHVRGPHSYENVAGFIDADRVRRGTLVEDQGVKMLRLFTDTEVNGRLEHIDVGPEHIKDFVNEISRV